MNQLATQGMTLDQVTASQMQAGQGAVWIVLRQRRSENCSADGEQHHQREDREAMLPKSPPPRQPGPSARKCPASNWLDMYRLNGGTLPRQYRTHARRMRGSNQAYNRSAARAATMTSAATIVTRASRTG